jgi:hypothetical protein
MKKTIYVPDDLAERMRKTEKGADVNWSAIACTAFVEKLNTIERQQKGASMSNVIERLSLSKMKGELATVTEGRRAGRKWAESRAEAIDLQRLEEARDGQHGWGFGVGQSAYTVGQQFYFIIGPNDDGDRQAAEAFWDSVTGDGDRDRDSAEFVNGFALGAMSLWDEVKDKI